MKKIGFFLLAFLLICSLSFPVSAVNLKTQGDEQQTVQDEEETPEDALDEEDELAVVEPSFERELLNDVDLSPGGPESEELNGFVGDIMKDFIVEDMNTYEQVKACYDYLVDNTTYGNHMAYMATPVGNTTCRQIYAEYGEVEGFGAVALSANVGMCNAYASGFIIMARKIGLNAYLVKGSTRSAGGGFVYHEWCEIEIDGVPYVFDPQLEQDLSPAGTNAYKVFCKPYSEVGAIYNK